MVVYTRWCIPRSVPWEATYLRVYNGCTMGGYIPRVYLSGCTREAMLGVPLRVYQGGYAGGISPYIPPGYMQGVYLSIYHPGIPPWVHHGMHHHHDCTGARCVQRRRCVREEALGSNLGLVRESEAKRGLLSPKV